MFEGILEMNEHLGHAGSGVGRTEWHFGHCLRPVTDVVDSTLRWTVDRSAARMSNWWNWNDIKR